MTVLFSGLRRVYRPGTDWLEPLETSKAREAEVSSSLTPRLAAIGFGEGCFHIELSAALRVQGAFPREGK